MASSDMMDDNMSSVTKSSISTTTSNNTDEEDVPDLLDNHEESGSNSANENLKPQEVSIDSELIVERSRHYDSTEQNSGYRESTQVYARERYVSSAEGKGDIDPYILSLAFGFDDQSHGALEKKQ